MSDDVAPSASPSDGGALQFDRVEHQSGAAPKFACFRCKRWLHVNYFAVNGQPHCERCRDALAEQLSGPISWKTWGRVLGSGGLAALCGTLIYFAVLKLTGYEIGLIAIVVGLMVGGAVRKTSNARGGPKLQAVAMLLTYGSIVMSYVPMVYEGVHSSAHDSNPILVGLVVVGAAAAMPWLLGFKNLMGWFIIGIALYEAWKLNRAIPFVADGPFPAPVVTRSAAATEDAAPPQQAVS